MSRHFTAAPGEYIDFAPGDIAANDGGPASFAILWRPTTNHIGTFIQASNAGGYEVWGNFPISDGYVWHSVGGSSRAVTQWSGTDPWRIDGMSKPDGATQMVRGHSCLLGGAWTHADASTSNDTGNGPAATLRVGQNNVATMPLNGDVAAIAYCSAVWTDEQFETLASGLAAWLTAIDTSPAVLYAFNQADVATDVTDLTGGGADQTGRSGTTVATDPPGFSYLLGSVGVLAGTIPTVVSAMTGTSQSAAVLAGTLPALTGQLAGATSAGGVLAGTLPAIIASLAQSVAISTPQVTSTIRVRSLSATVTPG